MPQRCLTRILLALACTLPIGDAARADATTGSISGTITAASSGQPVSGVVVTASWLFFAPQVVKATTDANGHYQLDGLSPGFSYKVVAKPGETLATLGWPDQDCFFNIFAESDLYWYYCSVGSNVAVTAGQVTTGIDFALPSAGIVEGHVMRTDTNLPVPGAAVWFGSHTTDASGFFHVGSAPPGQYGISVSANGLITMFNDGQQCDAFVDCGAITAYPISIAANAVTTLDFALARGVVIGGHVHVDDGSVPDGTYMVRIYDESDPQRPYVETYLDFSPGTYEQANLIPRSYSVRFGDPADTRYVSQYFSAVPCEQDPCDLSAITVFNTLPGQSIANADATIQSRQHVVGRVIDVADQTPIAGASVQADVVNCILWSCNLTVLAQGHTQADGTFTLASIPTNTAFALHTSAAGYLGLRNLDVICDQNNGFCSGYPQPFQVSLDQSLDLGDLALTKGALITGRVINSSNGTALAHAWVEIFSADVLAWTLQPDADGYYRTPPLSPGTLKLVGQSLTHEQMYDHVDCVGTCDLSLATPIVIEGTGVVAAVDFSVSDSDSLFSSGFGNGSD